MQKKTLTIINKLGLHARAAMKLVDTAARFQSKITFTKDNQTIDAKDILQAMSIGAVKGNTVEITATGNDESQAIAALSTLINDRFGEAE